jgi:hypothetical protein
MHEDMDIEELLDRLLVEITTYLAVVDAFRNENLEPEWAAESS